MRPDRQEQFDRIALLLREASMRRLGVWILLEGVHLYAIKKTASRFIQNLDPRSLEIVTVPVEGHDPGNLPFLLPYQASIPSLQRIQIMEHGYYHDLLMGLLSGRIPGSQRETILRQVAEFESTMEENGYLIIKADFWRSATKLKKDFRGRIRRRFLQVTLKDRFEAIMKHYFGYITLLRECRESIPGPVQWFVPSDEKPEAVQTLFYDYVIRRLEAALEIDSSRELEIFNVAMTQMRNADGDAVPEIEKDPKDAERERKNREKRNGHP